MTSSIKRRNTRLRQLVAQIFQNTPEPIALQDLFGYVKISFPKTAYSTVFRIVRRLKEEKLVHTVDWRERSSRYEWSELPHHHHIVCQVCGVITDLDDADLKYDENYIQKKTGYLTKHHSIELEGICPGCQQKQRLV
jgi:Fur family ferric uptake transcriptional regulator